MGINLILMPSKNSILFPLVSLALLALTAISGLLLFYLLPLIHRPSLLWYSASALAVIAIGVELSLLQSVCSAVSET